MDKKLFEQFLSSFKLLSTSNNVDIVLLSEGRKENARAVASNLSDEQFQELLNGDPSKDSPQNPFKYIEWMARQAKNGFSIYQIIELTKIYDDNLQIIPKDKPIQNFKTLKDLYNFISALDTEDYRDVEIDAATDRHNKSLELYIKSEEDKHYLVEDTEEYIVSRVLNVEGSCELAKVYQGRWCIAGAEPGIKPTYKPEDAAQAYGGYLGGRKILYFVMFKNLSLEAASKAYAVILDAGKFNESSGTFEPTIDSIHDRKDNEQEISIFTKNQERKPAYLAFMRDATKYGSTQDASRILSRSKTPEELKAGIDRYSKLMDKNQFDSLLDELKRKMGESIFKQAGIKTDYVNPFDKTQNTIHKGAFVTKNITQKNMESIGLFFRGMHGEVDTGISSLPPEKKAEMYDKFLNNFVNFANTLSETQYIFMLKKAALLDVNDIDTEFRYNAKGQGIFYTLIAPLLAFEVVENKVRKYHGSFQFVNLNSIFITGINNKLLDVLKKELLKKSNVELRNLFSKICVNSDLPKNLFNKQDDKSPKHNDLSANLRDFLLRTDNQYPITHIRELYRQIIDTISKVPYSSMTDRDVESVLAFTFKDINSVNTDEGREKIASNFRSKLPNLLQIMKATFPARKKYIKMLYDTRPESYYQDKLYDYEPVLKSTTANYTVLTKHKYIYTTAMNSSEILMSLDRAEINEYLTKVHGLSLSNYNQNLSISNLLNYVINLSGEKNFLSQNVKEPENVYEIFKAYDTSFISSLDMDSILTLVGPENGKFTEKTRIKYAINNYFQKLDDLNDIQNLAGGKMLDNGKILKPEEISEALNKTSDTIRDTIVQQLYVSEENHYNVILQNIQSFLEDPEKINNEKNGAMNIKKTISFFSLLLIRKLQIYIKLASLMQKSVTLTNQYGSEERKQKLNPIIKKMFEEKTNNYKELVKKYFDILLSNNISNISMQADAIKFPIMYNISATKSKGAAPYLRKSIDILEKLVDGIDAGRIAESKVRNLIKENRRIYIRLYK